MGTRFVRGISRISMTVPENLCCDNPVRGQQFYIRIHSKVKRNPCTGPKGSRKLRLPHFMTIAHEGGKVVSPTHRPPLPPGNNPGTHFCYMLFLPRESKPRPSGLQRSPLTNCTTACPITTHRVTNKFSVYRRRAVADDEVIASVQC